MIDRSVKLPNIIDKNKSFFLFGARGTGKSALLAASGLPTIDLLHSRAYQRYLSDPSLFGDEIEQMLSQAETKPLVVAVDEIQKLPILLDEIHRLIESHPRKLLFVLTGSSARKLKRGGANLLAGRALTYEVYPICSLEIEIDLTNALRFGTLPGILTDPPNAPRSLDAYVNTYLREEILEEALVRKADRFTRFLDLAAQLNGEPINYAKLARSLKTTGQTIQEYFSILVDTLIAYRLDGWSRSVKLQLLQMPKFYWFDCGVLNAMNGDLRSELSPSTFRFGRLFETWIIAELHRYNSYGDLGLRFHHWRDKLGREVDVIASRGTGAPLAAIEIKSSEAPLPEDVSGLALFAADYPKVPLWCFCRTPRSFRRDGIEFYPWSEGLKKLSQL